MKVKEKFCPLLSTQEKKVPCSIDCEWYYNDVIPGRCAMKECINGLDAIYKQMESIYMSMPDSPDSDTDA